MRTLIAAAFVILATSSAMALEGEISCKGSMQYKDHAEERNIGLFKYNKKFNFGGDELDIGYNGLVYHGGQSFQPSELFSSAPFYNLLILKLDRLSGEILVTYYTGVNQNFTPKIDDVIAPVQKDGKSYYLLKYFRGLCSQVEPLFR